MDGNCAIGGLQVFSDHNLSKGHVLEESLHRRLIEITIGGTGSSASSIDASHRDAVFAEYVRKALPSIKVTDLETLVTGASLNSVCASCYIEGKKYLLKIHVESKSDIDGQQRSMLGVGHEYENADLLERSGFPVVAPHLRGGDSAYPLLVYPWVDSETLFDKLENSYAIGRSLISAEDLARLADMNSTIGATTVRTMRHVPASEAKNSPVQALFLKRFARGGRVDDWYKPHTLFELPASDGGVLRLSWNVVKDARWAVNDLHYGVTISQMIASARQVLAYKGESTAPVSISHGDDHAGNIFVAVDEERGGVTARLFDPAFAGENPTILAHVKAFAHTGVLPMAGMYYDPHLPRAEYEYDARENLIRADVGFTGTPLFDVHHELAQQIIDRRIAPSISAMAKAGVAMDRELERFRCALAGCALLTVNVPLLLKAANHRAAGLLPAAVMLYSMSGLPSLEYLRTKTDPHWVGETA